MQFIKPAVVGIVGWAGSGKNTVSEIFVNHGYIQDSFAASLKDATSAVFGWSRSLLEGDTAESRTFRESIDEYWTSKLGYSVTPRVILQQVGTEVFRDNFHKDIWLNTVERRVGSRAQPTVISDCRFPNELQLIKQLGGPVIWVQRGSLPEWYGTALAASAGDASSISEMKSLGIHESEWAWLATTPDYIISNNSNLEELITSVTDLITTQFNRT